MSNDIVEPVNKLGLDEDQLLYIGQINGATDAGVQSGGIMASNFVLANTMIKASESSDRNSKRMALLTGALMFLGAIQVYLIYLN